MIATGRRQRGLALLMLLWLAILGAALLLEQQTHTWSLRHQRDAATDAALAQAREALIAFALSDGDQAGRQPGYLPCPDKGFRGSNRHEGSADPPCGNKGVSAIGRFPWLTLGVGPLRDGAGECLWYAVSGSFKDNPAADMLNWDSIGQLELHATDGNSLNAGTLAEELAAAVLFAPGPRLPGQQRQTTQETPLCGGNHGAGNYLDSGRGIDNAGLAAAPDALSSLIVGGNANGVNDRLLAITPREIFAAVRKRSDFPAKIREQMQRLALCIAAYGKKNHAGLGDQRLPWAAALALANPSDDAAYDDKAGRLIGHLPYGVATSKARAANAMTNTVLVTSEICGANPPDRGWYRNWKDHLFYAVAGAYAPSARRPGVCGPCLSVNGGGRYAAILIFAGPALGDQKRSSASDKAVLANYLEQRNALAGSDFFSTPATAEFNDLLYCIDTALQVAPCP